MLTRITLFLAALAVVGGGGAAAFFAASSSVQVLVDGDVRTTRTFASHVAEVLERLDIEVGPDDRVEPASDLPVGDGLRITVARAKTVEVHVEDEPVQVVVGAVDTVADVLREAGLGELVEDVVETPIERGEQRGDTDQLVEGQTRVDVEGEDGLRRDTYEVTLVDGEELERSLVSEEVVREPTDRVVLVGTAPGPVRQAQDRLAELGYPGRRGGRDRRSRDPSGSVRVAASRGAGGESRAARIR